MSSSLISRPPPGSSTPPTALHLLILIEDGHRENLAAAREAFSGLGRQYYERTWDAPSPAAINAALNVLEAQAQLDGPERHRPAAASQRGRQSGVPAGSAGRG